ncbi:ArdC family protein [Pantoea sp. B65]|uniref:ArdC family protein n=1 Tax=Pantoea sp. B65 TaxID=2813359 RepID=UPI0039B6684E
MERITDVYQQVTDEIIAAVEEGCIPWIRPWRDGEPVFPVNAALNRAYNGINIPLLWRSADRNGFEHDRWLTFRQALNVGGNVRKGEKSTLAVLYLPQEREEKDKNGEPLFDSNGQPKKQHFALLRTFRLFNLEQCDGLPQAWKQPVIQVSAPVEAAEAVISHSGVPVVHRRQQRAYYYPHRDVIVMPHPEQFDNADEYYGTLLHEITHATGHLTRLAREGITSENKTFGDPVYAFEELVAEMGSAFICAQTGIRANLQHAGYIESWLRVLRNDKRAIIRASGLARNACEWLLERVNQPVQITA